MARVLDIGIAGCGVAGLASALLLKRAGHRITLFDKMAHPAPVGSGLLIQPTGLSVLADLGLAEALCGQGQMIGASAVWKPRAAGWCWRSTTPPAARAAGA